jgi:phosphoribosyl-AMP cyclohydrolase
MQEPTSIEWLDDINWSEDGLIPAIAQDASSKRILMVAWMNREALLQTRKEGIAIYWSRSRQKLWRKGEESGHIQHVSEIRLDCDSDVITLQVEQTGGIACHTGRESCFFKVLNQDRWEIADAVIKNPREIYESD